MNELVVVRNDVLVTDSRTVAEYFGKKHKNVIRDVENIIDDLKAIDVEETAPLCDGLKNEPVKEMFFVDTYIDAKGESRKMYWLTEDGFTLLAMGFTGVKALKVKLAFIAEFNRMRNALRDLRNTKDKAEATAMLITSRVRLNHCKNCSMCKRGSLSLKQSTSLNEMPTSISSPLKRSSRRQNTMSVCSILLSSVSSSIMSLQSRSIKSSAASDCKKRLMASMYLPIRGSVSAK